MNVVSRRQVHKFICMERIGISYFSLYPLQMILHRPIDRSIEIDR